MFDRILTVCDGNICRSPTAAAMLRRHRPEKRVTSAGLVGLEGQDMDPVAREVAREHGLDCGEHVARKLMGAHCRDAKIILVMEARQRDALIKSYPEVSGKVFLLSHWNGGRNIPDPYRRGKDAFEQVYRLLDKAAEAWAGKL